MRSLCDCEGSFRITRRGFLQATAILSFAALPELTFAAAPTQTRLLVILLRGGMDGLFAMPPVGDKSLSGLRRNINPDDLQKLDGFFALHPALANVGKLYGSGQALLVHGISNPYVGRSHFEGQDIMESGVATPYASSSGWLGRTLDIIGNPSITMSLPVPLILRGKDRPDTDYPSWIKSLPATMYESLLPLWMADPDLAPFGQQLEAQKAQLSMAPRIYVGDANSLQDLAGQAAKRLTDPAGPRIAVLDHVGFDSHSNEPSFQSERLREVDDAIGAFQNGMGKLWKDTLVVTVTEFGRTAAENGSHGTDHGWGTAVFVVGGKLKKSGIVADWPGLKKKSLFEGRDLMATLDSRALYGAIISKAFEIDSSRVQKEILDHQTVDIYDQYI